MATAATSNETPNMATQSPVNGFDLPGTRGAPGSTASLGLNEGSREYGGRTNLTNTMRTQTQMSGTPAQSTPTQTRNTPALSATVLRMGSTVQSTPAHPNGEQGTTAESLLSHLDGNPTSRGQAHAQPVDYVQHEEAPQQYAQESSNIDGTGQGEAPQLAQSSLPPSH